MPRGVVRPPWGKEMVPYIKVVCEEYGVPPFRLTAKCWEGKCQKCVGYAVYSYQMCPRHVSLTNKRILDMYSRFARAVVECSALRLEELRAAYERKDHMGVVGYIRYLPRILVMIEEVGNRLEDALAVEMPSKGRKRAKKSVEAQEWMATLLEAGDRTLLWYIDRLERIDKEVEETMGALEELVLWACGFVEAVRDVS